MIWSNILIDVYSSTKVLLYISVSSGYRGGVDDYNSIIKWKKSRCLRLPVSLICFFILFTIMKNYICTPTKILCSCVIIKYNTYT